jgi:hypothetical protein
MLQLWNRSSIIARGEQATRKHLRARKSQLFCRQCHARSFQKGGGMSLAPELAMGFPRTSEVQQTIVGHTNGPLLVIAGTGSGKAKPTSLAEAVDPAKLDRRNLV